MDSMCHRENEYFIHQLPLRTYNLMCMILNKNDRWHSLAQNFGYEDIIIDQIACSSSPAAKLLTMWSDQNYTTNDLYMALFKINDFETMEYLRDCVDKSFHRLNRSTMNTSLSSIQSNSKLRSRLKKLKDPFAHKHLGVPQIDYVELTNATNQWERVLGSGTYGTVYRGKWKCTDVAIKRINCKNVSQSSLPSAHGGLRQLLVEIQFLNAYRHDNILPLYGYSFDGSSACLVYQMMVGRSLEHRLHISKQRLTYRHRLGIAIGAAKGIQFLHTFKAQPAVHGDIKSANILLDECLVPKIGDFGLARQSFGTKRASKVYGSRPYLSDEFIDNLQITTKNDVYSFGVVLLELATGLTALELAESSFRHSTNQLGTFEEHSSHISQQIDCTETSRSTHAEAVLLELMKLGFLCTRPKAIKRPDMSTVLDYLQRIQI